MDTTIQNNKKQAALHLATEHNKVNVLKVMSAFHAKFNPHQGGEHGRTALHLAAIYDYAECAYILVRTPHFTLIRPTLLILVLNLRHLRSSYLV